MAMHEVLFQVVIIFIIILVSYASRQKLAELLIGPSPAEEFPCSCL